MHVSEEEDRFEHKATLNFESTPVEVDDAPSGKRNNETGEGQLPSQKPVRRIKLLIVAVEAADTTQEVVLESIIDCSKLKSPDSTSQMATSRPSMEKMLEISAVLIVDDIGVVVGGIFSLWMMMPTARLLTKFGVLLVIVVGSRRREVSAPEVEKYGGCGGGEMNDSDDDKGRDGVNATGVATTY